MFNLRTIALKLFRAGKTQAITSIITVAIAIALVVMMCTYGFSAKEKLDEDIYELYGDSNIEFGYELEDERYIDKKQLTQVANLSGVMAVAPILLNPEVTVEGISINMLGVNNDELTKSRLHFTDNIEQNEIIVSERLLHSLEKSIGDQLEVGHQTFTIADTLPIHEFNTAYITNADMKSLFPYMQEGKFVLVQTIPELEETVGTQIAKMDEYLRVDLLNESEAMQKNIEGLLVFIVVLSLFVLIITGTLLLSNFRIIFTKLQKQLMRLRAIGATMTQVALIVLTQLTTIIIIGVLAGTLLGVGMMKFGLHRIIRSLALPPVQTTIPVITVIVIALVSLVVLQLFVMWQVWKSTNVLPMQMKQLEKQVVWTRKKGWVSSGVAVIAIFLLLIGMRENAPVQSFIGSAMMTVLFIYVLPYVFKWCIQHSLPYLRGIFGKNFYIALQRLLPQVRKNMSAILTIISVMVILVFSTATMKSVAVSSEQYIDNKFETEVHGTYDLSDITGEQTLELLADIRNLEGVRDVYASSGIASLGVQLPNEMIDADVQATNLAYRDQQYPVTGAVVKESFAKEHHIEVGDVLLIIDYYNNQNYEPLLVSAISDESTLFQYSDIVVDWSEEIANVLYMHEVFVDADDVEVLQPIMSKLPAMHFTTKTAELEEEYKMFQQRYVLVIGTLIVLIIGASFGVLQTLTNDILSQQSSYRITRLLGLTQNGMMSVIVWQALIFVCYGIVFGLTFGIFFTKLLWHVIDPASSTLVDGTAVLYTVAIIFVLTLICFTLQGYQMSRRQL
ncbi:MULTISPECIES: FtsX-like permease family protein [Oceanobacillus]|uniref:ABC transporter permease n=1 Tax=Oceanobacillus indicireducens TaxID=1004261 RepID=A0A917XUR7_9BACI|nr:FtsX-like permease family protein [Oceanobacillus indicireducens]GGN54462.1 ABC transporter permease [Oceanobacillus indicireducens]